MIWLSSSDESDWLSKFDSINLNNCNLKAIIVIIKINIKPKKLIKIKIVNFVLD